MKTLEKVVTGEGLKEGQSQGQVRISWRYVFVDSSRMFQGRSNEVSRGRGRLSTCCRVGADDEIGRPAIRLDTIGRWMGKSNTTLVTVEICFLHQNLPRRAVKKGS